MICVIAAINIKNGTTQRLEYIIENDYDFDVKERCVNYHYKSFCYLLCYNQSDCDENSNESCEYSDQEESLYLLAFP